MLYRVEQDCIAEVSFSSSDARAGDPYRDIDLDAAFTGPAGQFVIPAYWAGDNVWKVRFSGPTPGTYRFETRCSNTRDSGLHGRTGTIEVLPYTGSNPLSRHGRLRVAESRRHFIHADGMPFFWLGDTWWMGLTTRLDWPPGFQALTADRVGKGFNVIQIIAGPYPDMDAWDPRGRNEAGFPFTEGFESINPAYYDHADLKIAHLAGSGLVPCIVGMWGYYLPQLGLERVKRFWRYLVARYGAYPVVWCIAGEATMPYYLSETKDEDKAAQKRGWTEVMRYVREIDGYHNLISIHPTQFGREQVEDPGLMDFEMLQTGHGDLESVGNTEETVLEAVRREPMMPVVNSEVNYEGILGRAWQNVQRLCLYKSILNGTAGHTYGANGIWQLNEHGRPYGPSPHGRSWGSTPWTEASQLPGSRQMGHGRRFIERFEWWRLSRHPEWLDPQPKPGDPYGLVCTGIPGDVGILYVPLLWNPPTISGFPAGGNYSAYYYDPRSGAEIDLGAVIPDADGRWSPPLPPEVSDWLIVLRRQT